MNSAKGSRRQAAVVLLSAGLDSTVSLFAIRDVFDIKLLLTFDYGQRAAARETARAAEIARGVSLPHQVISLPFLAEATSTGLVNRSAVVPQGAQVDIDSIAQSTNSARQVWVPNRNGLFLNIAATLAEQFGEPDRPAVVVPGFNREEAATFPDNSADFVEAANRAFAYSTQGRVVVQSPTIGLNKTEIYRLGLSLRAPLDRVWPCYFAQEMPCGQCESCQRYLRAKREAEATQ